MPEWLFLHGRVLRVTLDAQTLFVQALGSTLSISVSDAYTERLVAEFLADLIVPAVDGPAHQESVALDPEGDIGDALVALMGTINFAALHAARGQLLPHAGAVAREDGSMAIFCAPSGGGKSTLTTTMVRRGYAYVTDETLAIDPAQLRITPFRKPIALKAGAQRLYPELRPSWSQSSGGTWMVPSKAVRDVPLPTSPLTPDLLIFPTYVAGAPLVVEPVRPGEAAYLVGQQSSSLVAVDGGPLPALARLARRAPAFRITHSDAESAADEISHLWQAG